MSAARLRLGGVQRSLLHGSVDTCDFNVRISYMYSLGKVWFSILVEY
jgi:hypothetical protein